MREVHLSQALSMWLGVFWMARRKVRFEEIRFGNNNLLFTVAFKIYQLIKTQSSNRAVALPSESAAVSALGVCFVFLRYCCQNEPEAYLLYSKPPYIWRD
jgi:hypothetical protein